MQRLALAVLVLAFLVSACGAGEPAGVGVSTSRGEPATTAPAPAPEQLYEANVMVLEAEDGPMLCLGAMRMIYPPHCGDVPIANWDWHAVEGEQSDMGTTWDRFHLVGTLADGAFTVAEIQPPDPGREDFGTDPDLTPPCPEPDGGWVDVDPTLASARDFDRGAARARARRDFVVLWVRYVGNPTPDEVEHLEAEGRLPQRIMNVVVTEDVAGAEAAIRSAWGGPLCVVARAGPTAKELRAIRAEAERWLEEDLGLTMTWSQDGPLGQGAAEVGVLIDPGGAGQAALDERYGEGRVRLFPALRPVEPSSS